MGKYIISDPTILSGMPVIKGTRVPIVRILTLLKEGYTIEEIQEQFDQLGDIIANQPNLSDEMYKRLMDEKLRRLMDAYYDVIEELRGIS